MTGSLKGQLRKMKAGIREVVYYDLDLDGVSVHMNDLLGKKLTLKYTGEIHCIRCGRQTKKSFAQGYCYPCFISAPETSECVIRPELCQAHLGISRDMAWSEKHCLQDHIVYLALSSSVKVGVTRSGQVPVRWIDQGAWKAIILARTPNRYTAGLIEVSLKEHLNDKTNWRKMLTNQVNSEIDLRYEKSGILSLIYGEFKEFLIQDDEITEINYPVISYPGKVRSLNLDKTPDIEGKLSGIKGQYLIFEEGNVLNVRKHSGYLVELSY